MGATGDQNHFKKQKGPCLKPLLHQQKGTKTLHMKRMTDVESAYLSIMVHIGCTILASLPIAGGCHGCSSCHLLLGNSLVGLIIAVCTLLLIIHVLFNHLK